MTTEGIFFLCCSSSAAIYKKNPSYIGTPIIRRNTTHKMQLLQTYDDCTSAKNKSSTLKEGYSLMCVAFFRFSSNHLVGVAVTNLFENQLNSPTPYTCRFTFTHKWSFLPIAWNSNRQNSAALTPWKCLTQPNLIPHNSTHISDWFVWHVLWGSSPTSRGFKMDRPPLRDFYFFSLLVECPHLKQTPSQ